MKQTYLLLIQRHSVYSDEGLDKSEMIKIIESTDYPSFDGETENNGEAQTEN